MKNDKIAVVGLFGTTIIPQVLFFIITLRCQEMGHVASLLDESAINTKSGPSFELLCVRALCSPSVSKTKKAADEN